MKGVFVRACLLCVFLDGCSGGSSACGLVGAHGDTLQGSRRQACFAPSLLGHFLLGGHGGEAAELAWRPSCHQASCVRRGQLAGAPVWSGLGENLGDFGARRRIVLGSRILGTGTGTGGGSCGDGRMAGTRLGLAMTSASDASHGRPGSADPKRKWSVVRADGRKGARRSSRPAGGSEWRPGDALPGDTRQCNAALQQLARRGDARTAAILLESMDSAGVKRDVYTYNSAMNACCRSSKRSRGMLEDMLTEMQGRGIKPSTVTYNTLLKGAAYIRDVGWAESLVKGMKDAGLDKDHITYSTFVNVCSVAGNIGRAMKGLEEMLGAGISPTESTLTSIIKGCEVAGDLDSARKAYEHSNAGMSSAVRNSMADCLTANGMPEEALELLGVSAVALGRGASERGADEQEEVEEAKVVLDTVLLNSAMKALRSLRDVTGSLSLLKQACLVPIAKGGRAAAATPDAITMNILTDALCLSNNILLARACIDALHSDEPGPASSAGGPLDSPADIIRAAAGLVKPRCAHTHQYNSLIRALGYMDSGEGDDAELEECFQLVDEMRDRQVSVDEVVLTTLVNACAYRGRSDMAAEVVERAVEQNAQRDSRPTAATFNALIKAYRANGQMDEAKGVIGRMQEAKVQPDLVSFNTLLDAALMSGRHSDATALLQDMARAGLKPDTTTHNTLIKGYAKSKELSKAMAVLGDMRKAGLVPDQRTYSALAEACGNQGDVSRVLEMKELLGRGARREHEQVCREALIKAYAVSRDVEMAMSVSKNMRREGMELSSKGWAALMDAHANIGEPYTAMECMREMEDLGIEANNVHKSILLKAFCNAGILDEAIALLRNGIAFPDAVCYNILIAAAIRSKDLDALVNILRDMEQSGVEPDARTQAALDRAASTAASLKVGSVLKTFSSGFKSALADAIGGGP